MLKIKIFLFYFFSRKFLYGKSRFSIEKREKKPRKYYKNKTNTLKRRRRITKNCARITLFSAALFSIINIG